MEISIKFQSVNDEMPQGEPDDHYDNDYSIECMAVVEGAVFDRSVRYCFKGLGGWVWADMALGHEPNHYFEELGADKPKVTHWAPWPVVGARLGVATCV
jgi:hypothetical protein